MKMKKQFKYKREIVKAYKCWLLEVEETSGKDGKTRIYELLTNCKKCQGNAKNKCYCK